MSADRNGSDVGSALSPDDRAAARAFLQRSEVRLSTMHRVAAAMLSGAGLMVILPAVERDSVVNVLRLLLSGRADASHLLLAGALAIALSLPFTALWLVLRDLTQFYFHANHLRHSGGEAFTPRFTLTSLRLPTDDLSADASELLAAARTEPRTIELLVPPNSAARGRIDRQVAAYGMLGATQNTDLDRANALFELAASRPRGLMEEVAKIETGMARHVLRTQVIVLRYVKALLALLTTALAVFGLAAVVADSSSVRTTDEVWLAAILMLWAPAVVAVVTSPVRWLDRQLRGEGATHSAVVDDHELTRMETVTIRLALVTFLVALGGMIVSLTSVDLSVRARSTGIAVAILSGAALAIAMRAWAGRDIVTRLVRRS